MGRTLVGKYRLDSLLGQGGMGSVWRGVHVTTGRKVAVKILDEKYLSNANIVQRFGREARAASAIAHEGIVEILDIDQMDEGIPFLVMEFLEGESLAHRIDYGARMSEHEVVSLGAQLLDALHAAHESGVIHRDLKPDNIYLVPGARGERVKLLDFGISSKTDEQDAKLTITGTVLGTPHYMSPEQAMGEIETDRRADVYSAGVVLYECLVGAVPFDGANYNKLLRVILDSEPEPPSERGAHVSSAVEAVILSALSKRKEDRPPTAAEMRRRLLAAHRSEDSSPAHRRAGGVDLPDPGVALAPREPARALGAGRTEDSVAIRWIGAELELGAPAQAPLEPTPKARADAPPRSTSPSRVAARSGEEGRASFGDDPLAPSSGAAALELDEGALPRKSASRTSLSRISAIETSSGSMGTGTSAQRLPAATSAARGSGSTGGSPAIGGGPVEAEAPARAPSVGVRSGARESARSEPRHDASPVRWVFGTLAGLAIVVLLAFGLRSVLKPEPRTEDPATALASASDEPAGRAASRSPSSAFVEIDVVVQPLEAEERMRLDGIPGATSPIRVRQGTTHLLEVTATGFVAQRIPIVGDRSRRLVVELERTP